ncbi:HK97-gp10 family putative phage morphogenesis protein [Clostridium thermarum]|uniref:HK97-gp10 family putative phage morphogenesis protein n=1 Tax=Clostridium thermarum TaxID=1716543 RepID=UPI00112310B0|nr:HK97-gp10 family putative phage morphogenesis protein [Clostridium thermarum]
MVKIEIEGMQELIDKVNKLGAKGDEIKKNALDKAGKLVKETMEKKAPRSKENKKHMADNIKVSDIERSNGIDFVKIGPDKGDVSEFYYSKFTEWGTSKIPAQHWASKSVKENQRGINQIIKEELERGLRELD